MNPANANSNTLKIPTLLIRIFGFIRPFLGLLILSLIINTVFSVLTVVSITMIKPIIQILFNTNLPIDTGIKGGEISGKLLDIFYGWLSGFIFAAGGNGEALIRLSAFIISVFIIKNIFKYIGSIITVKVEEGIIKSIRDNIFYKLTNLSIEFFSRTKVGNIISIITNDVSALNSTTVSTFTSILRESIQIALFLFLLISISPYLSFIAFSTTVVSFILLRISIKYLRRYASRMQAAMADFTTTLQESISGIRVIKGYNAEKTVSSKFTGDTSRYVSSAIKHTKIISMVPSINEIFAISALAVVLFVGGSQVFQGRMQADDLMTFLFSLFAIMGPVAAVVNGISQFQRGFVAAGRIFSVLDTEEKVVSGSEDIDKFEGNIEMKNVSFAYNETVVIRDAFINISKGKKIAFVGLSGSGKSTMLDLLIRFYDPQEGEIIIDGRKIKDLKADSYRSLFGIVSQESMLFNDTISNNIRFGDECITDEQIINAAKIANAYDFVMKLPKGFDTEIGDRGVILSGGERQRISIARAIARNPKILVFDEATSSLDAESEKIVQEAINKSLEDRTAVIVAHRLATIIDCDEIIVFDCGRIAERGSHQSLLAQNGIYKKLYDIQFNDKITVS